MKDKGLVWDAIVGENKLHPTKIEEYGNWWFANLILIGPWHLFLAWIKVKSVILLYFQNIKNSLGYKWIVKTMNLCHPICVLWNKNRVYGLHDELMMETNGCVSHIWV